MTLQIPPKDRRRWDLVALGEVMLRFDPGEARIHTARTFRVWEGGGEYNVARGLKRCFGLDTALISAFADNPIGRLVQDLIFQGGVDQSHVRWVKYDGVGRESRNGLNFVERGYGGTTAPENDAAYTLLHLVDDMVELVTQLESSGDRKAVYADGFTRTGFRGGLNWYRNMTRSWS